MAAQEFSVSLRDSGDLVKDGFATEDDAYAWLKAQVDGDLDDFVVEPSNQDD
jgi:hypothetical protein